MTDLPQTPHTRYCCAEPGGTVPKGVPPGMGGEMRATL
jgi:hypothetical protein